MILAYLRLDSVKERAESQEITVSRGEKNIICLSKYNTLSEHSKMRFKVLRVKQVFECERLSESIDCLQRRLLGVLDARVRALEAPQGAHNAIQFQNMCQASEECTFSHPFTQRLSSCLTLLASSICIGYFLLFLHILRHLFSFTEVFVV